MSHEKRSCESVKIALFIGLCFLVLAVTVEYIAIIRMNDGYFTYTLDDPYIHMALAENIQNGHYGVNADEFSAPSSSILWPFILAPFSSTAFFVYTPLLINLISSMGIVYLFYKILERSIQNIGIGEKRTIISCSIVLLILATNIVGLIFTGMEHSLQVLFVVMILWGMLLEIETKRVAPWLVFVIIVAPLIRYENLAISCAAIIYLAFCKYYKQTIALICLIVLLMGLFSVFLMKLGLGPLPTSVISKSPVISSGGNVMVILRNFFIDQNDMGHIIGNNGDTTTLMLSCGLLSLISFVLFSRDRKRKRLLAGVISFSVIAHLLVGDNGWFFRYEIYVWTVLILTLIYINSRTILQACTSSTGRVYTKRIVVVLTLVIFVISANYISSLAVVRIASNNIYQQQYQMHRFAVDYYNKPIAVGDLGYVSFENDNYVLDLVGLASISALNYSRSSDNPEWMNTLSEENNVRYAMIYENRFSHIPANWIKMGELHLGRQRITPAESVVSFYAIGEETSRETAAILREFTNSLPDGVTFIYCI